MKKQRFKIGQKAYMRIGVEVKAINKENGTLEAIFSTQDVDRHGDTVVQSGWDIKEFKSNPVILNSHNYDDATEVVGQASNVRVEKRKLMGDIKFAVEENPKAKIIFDLYAGKYLRAFSVGFIPRKFKENKDGSKDWFVIEEAQLLEVSAVSVPVNARALAKQKGIDVDKLETSEEDEDYEDDQDEPGAGKADDGVPENPPAPEADGDAAAEDGNGDQGEPEGGDADSGDDAGDGESGEDGADEAEGAAVDGEDAGDEGDENDEPEPGEKGIEPEPAPAGASAAPKPSYKQRVARTIRLMHERERAQIERAKRIIDGLLEEKGVPKENESVAKQVRKRKINQAIRNLYRAK